MAKLMVCIVCTCVVLVGFFCFCDKGAVASVGLLHYPGQLLSIHDENESFANDGKTGKSKPTATKLHHMVVPPKLVRQLQEAEEADELMIQQLHKELAKSRGGHGDMNKEEMQEEWIPRLIIAGTQKGGTTALQNVLQKQKHFCRNSKDYKRDNKNTCECHYFDWVLHEEHETKPLPGLTSKEWQGFLRDEEGGLTDNVLQALRREHKKLWKINGVDLQNVVTFEKSPRHMMYPVH